MCCVTPTMLAAALAGCAGASGKCMSGHFCKASIAPAGYCTLSGNCSIKRSIRSSRAMIAANRASIDARAMTM